MQALPSLCHVMSLSCHVFVESNMNTLRTALMNQKGTHGGMQGCATLKIKDPTFAGRLFGGLVALLLLAPTWVDAG